MQIFVYNINEKKIRNWTSMNRNYPSRNKYRRHYHYFEAYLDVHNKILDASFIEQYVSCWYFLLLIIQILTMILFVFKYRIIRSFVVFWKYINYLDLLRVIIRVIYVVKFDEWCKKSLSLSAKPILIIFRLIVEKWYFDGKLLWRIFLCEILIQKLKYDKSICELRIF
jgi:hypothetical protein